MKTYEATRFEKGKEITLSNAEQLEQLYKSIKNEETFILRWTEGSTNKSQVMIGKDWVTKLENGELKIIAIEPKRG